MRQKTRNINSFKFTRRTYREIYMGNGMMKRVTSKNFNATMRCGKSVEYNPAYFSFFLKRIE